MNGETPRGGWESGVDGQPRTKILGHDVGEVEADFNPWLARDAPAERVMLGAMLSRPAAAHSVIPGVLAVKA